MFSSYRLENLFSVMRLTRVPLSSSNHEVNTAVEARRSDRLSLLLEVDEESIVGLYLLVSSVKSLLKGQ